jgi:hypothetical protein
MSHMAIEKALGGVTLGERTSFRNLAVFTLLAPETREPGYLTLDEAVATGRFRIIEVSGGGSVPELRATNGLDRPVLLLEGEELIGAKQNRVLNLSILVPANAALIVPVSCVEAGRWHTRSAQFAPAPRAQFARGRATKTEQVSDSLRATGLRRSDQQDVWREIHDKATRMAVRSETGAMSDIYDRHADRVEDYVAGLPPIEGQAGAVFAIAATVLGMDLFDSARTFARVGPKLVRSYALDALEAPVEGFAAPEGARAAEFLERVGAAEVQEFPAVGAGADLRLTGDSLTGAGLLADGTLVHLSAFHLERGGREPNPFAARMARASQRRASGEARQQASR